MAFKALPSPEVLRQLLRYEPDTGKLFWKERPVEMFKAGALTSAQSCAAWNGKYAGKETFTTDNGVGYRQGTIFNEAHRAHRVIWAMVTGAPQIGDIDHINGNRADNRWANLRDVTHAENQRNMQKFSTNKSGAMGVCWANRERRWYAYIHISGRSKNLGQFDEFHEAVAARKAAEIEQGYHANHGRENPHEAPK